MRLVNILCQHGRRKAGCLVLEDDPSRLVSLLVVEPSLGVEKQEVWYVFILREPFPTGVTLLDDTKSESSLYWF